MYFAYGEHQIYYERHGQGAPLVVLNGIFMNAASWAPFIETFARGNELILVDMLDQGRSARMTHEYPQDTQTEVVAQLLEHLGLGSYRVLGVSYGGQVAIRLAAEHPHLVERLVLANTTAWVSPWLEDLGHSWGYALSSQDGRQFFKTCMPLIYSPKFYAANIDWLHAREKMFQERFTPEVYQAFLRLLMSTARLDLRASLPHILAPTLVISSDTDYISPLADSELIAQSIPGAKQIILKNCGHASMYEQPVEFASAVLGFLASDWRLKVV